MLAAHAHVETCKQWHQHLCRPRQKLEQVLLLLTQVPLPVLACFQRRSWVLDPLAVNWPHVMPHGGAPCVGTKSGRGRDVEASPGLGLI